jgi:hypothetical protein
MSVRQIVGSVERPFGKMSVRQDVRSDEIKSLFQDISLGMLVQGGPEAPKSTPPPIFPGLAATVFLLQRKILLP